MARYRKRFQSKYLISGPAPLGRILNYIKRIKKKQYRTCERGPRRSNNLDDWTVCFMVGLGLIKDPRSLPLRISLNSEGKCIYKAIKSLPDFPDNPLRSRADMLSIKRDLSANNPPLYQELKNTFLESDVLLNLLTFLQDNNSETIERDTFYEEYGAIFEIERAGFNRLPSLLQIAEFCDILREEESIIRVISGVPIRSQVDLVKEHLVEAKRRLRQTGEPTVEEEDFLEDIPKNLPPKKRQVVTTQILRDTRISAKLKILYNNKCQICGFTFAKKGGGLYSESHHLVPLGSKGADVISNIVVLCPNCHKQLHYAKVKYGRKQNNKMFLKINNVRKSMSYRPNHFKAVNRL